MVTIHGNSKGKLIRNLLTVLGSAIILSVAILILMLSFYGPSGSYFAKNVLISPENVKEVSFFKTRDSHFVLKPIKFSYFDPRQKTMKHSEIDQITYAKLYELLKSDESVPEASIEFKAPFNHIAVLSLPINLANADQETSKVNQKAGTASSKNLFEIDFIKDYYRISLRDQNSDQQWAYFKHMGILEKLLELLHNGNNES